MINTQQQFIEHFNSRPTGKKILIYKMAIKKEFYELAAQLYNLLTTKEKQIINGK